MCFLLFEYGQKKFGWEVNFDKQNLPLDQSSVEAGS